MSLDSKMRALMCMLAVALLCGVGCGDDDDDDDDDVPDASGDTGTGGDAGGDGSMMCEVPDDTPSGQCTNAADMGAIVDMTTMMQKAVYGPMMNKTSSDIAADCAVACFMAQATCFMAPDADRAAQLNRCIRTGSLTEGGTGFENPVPISDSCADCFVRSAACSASACLAQCASGPNSQACVDCRCDNCCFDVFTECSGLPATSACTPPG